ncbi:MAG TPA: hypothetical protein VM537_13730 [Anaerolineae bacterium]|nr:hypothetical protein [Anaerolineae bacterium]
MLRQCVDCHGVKGATVCTRCGDTGQVPVFVSTERPDIKGFLASAAVLDSEFDNSEDIERDEKIFGLLRSAGAVEIQWAENNPVVQAWRDLDNIAERATKSQLVAAMMYLNRSIKGEDRKAIYRILGGGK